MPTSLPPRRAAARTSFQEMFSALTLSVLILACAAVVIVAEAQSPGTIDMSVYTEALFGP